MSSCKRWSREEKKHIHVHMLRTIKEFNLDMGVVDLANMLIELYQIDVKYKKWYSKIAHLCFDVAVVNSWLLNRRQMAQLQETKILSLKDSGAALQVHKQEQEKCWERSEDVHLLTRIPQKRNVHG